MPFPEQSTDPVSHYLAANVDIDTRIKQMVFLAQTGLLPKLTRSARKDSDVLTQLKWLFLAHSFILEDALSPEQIDGLIECMPEPRCVSQLEAMLIRRFQQPYKLYLQRRNSLGTTNDPVNDSFTLMNLIRRAAAFTDIIFLIGRYLYREHRFLAEFNILIARDLAELYSALRGRMDREMAMENLEEIEKMNEALYNVYYNCYFSRFVATKAPVYIDTQKLYMAREEKFRSGKRLSHPSEKDISPQTFHTIESETHIPASECAIKSTSTIGSHTQITHQQPSDDPKSVAAAQFIEMASQLLQQMEMSCQEQ